MNTFSYSQYLDLDTEETRVDQIGLAILRQHAREADLLIVGDVTRTGDVPVYAVGGGFVVAEMAGTAIADGPAGRLVTWEAPARSAIPAPTPLLFATKVNETTATLELPQATAREGGLVEIVHGLGGEVTALALSADAHSVNYRLAAAITDDKLEIDLIPGLAASIKILLDEPEDKEN